MDWEIDHAPPEKITLIVIVSCYGCRLPILTLTTHAGSISLYTCLGALIMYVFGMVPHTQLTQEGPKFPIQSKALGVVCKTGCRRAPHPARWSVYHTGGEVAVWTGIRSIELWRIITTWTYKDKLPLYVMYRALENW